MDIQPPAYETRLAILQSKAEQRGLETTPAVTPGLILEAVGESFQMAPGDLAGAKRDKATALARRVAMYVLRQETSLSVAQIGETLGGRDASAVTNAGKKVTAEMGDNRFLSRKIQDIQKIINFKSTTSRR